MALKVRPWARAFFCAAALSFLSVLKIIFGIHIGKYIPRISSVPTLIEQSQLVARNGLGDDHGLQRKQLIHGHSLKHGEAQDL
jgi:hypothetical protein